MQVNVMAQSKVISYQFQYLILICLTLLAISLPNISFAQTSTANFQEWHYTLRPSDNLQQISKRMLNRQHSWSDLVRYNQIDNVAAIEPGSIIRIPMKWLKHQPRPAKVMSVVGSAQIKPINASYFKILKANASINVGDEVATKNGTLLIKLADGSIVRLEKHSNLIFNKLSHYGQTGMVDTRMRLKKGSLSTDVVPMVKGSRYEITTPSAVAAVRGTNFRLESSNNETKIEVIKGTVDFSHKYGRVLVQAGEGARIKQGSHIIERSILPLPPKAQFAENKITDLPATLQWEDKQNAQGFKYELTDSNNKLIQSSSLKKPEVTLEHIRNGEYQVSMRTVNSKGFEGIDERSNVSINITSEMAELLRPLNNDIMNSTKTTFEWRFKGSSILGKLEISDSENFNTILSRFNFNKKSKITLNKALKPGDYFWRIIALSDDNKESTSIIRSLSIRGMLKPVKILSVNYIDNQVGLFWRKISHASTYILQISDANNFQNILKEETISRTKAHLKLTPGKQYYARVKGVGNERYSSEFGPIKELYIKK